MNNQNYIAVPALLLVPLRDYIRSFTDLLMVFFAYQTAGWDVRFLLLGKGR
jgi:hypothetical protein